MAIQETLEFSSPPPPSGSSDSNPKRYDVFLTFRGEDTRKNFTDHLYAALDREGIYTFRDDEELERGKPISTSIFQAIEQSRIALVVLSRNYASSTWCLDEILKIVECMNQMGQTVLPVFYDVDPSDVRRQTGSFAGAFDAHEQRFKDGLNKVQRWRDTLTQIANIRGFHLQNRHEYEFIEEIVEYIASRLDRALPSVSRDLVGIGSRVQEMMKLCAGTKKNNDVYFIGIWGMGGIGKTTLAQCFVDKMANQYDATSFLNNVREVSAERDGTGIVTLQEKLLSDAQMGTGTKKLDVYKGMNEIKHRLSYKKVLIVIDDVDHIKQLEALVGSHEWFGRGSRIIITTRNEHLLTNHGVDVIYEAQKLRTDEALKLFSCKAFKNRNHDDKEKYMVLSDKFVKYTNGLPLAIEVLGHFLCGRSIEEWESTNTRYKLGNLDDEIMEVLAIGFDGLHTQEKQIFLDIACFFKGKDKDHAAMILQSFGLVPDISIRVLIEKALITIVQGKLWMHDLLQEMGWKIIHQECPKEPGNRSRLWHWKDSLHVLQHNKGSDVVEGIVLNLPQEQTVQLNCDAFTKMKKLKFLKISDVLLPRGLNYLSTELRVIEWHGYPSKLLPSNFPSSELVLLNMCCSHIKYLWKGCKLLDKLKSIELSHSESLIETPDFSGVRNLEILILKGCTKLYKVHPSIGTLKRLVLLNMENCKILESLSCIISLGNLESFILSGCARLKTFPEIVGSMGRLSKLFLNGTALQDLPSSVHHLTGLTLLDLRDCKNLLRISSAIASLISLKNITLSGCENLEEIPEQIGGVESLEELDVSGTAIRQMPLSIVGLKKLKTLSCSGCKGQLSTSWRLRWFPAVCPGMGLLLPSSFSGLSSLTNLNLSYCNLLDGGIPNDLDSLASLRNLNLIGNNFTTIPESICGLSKLTELYVRDCSKLQSFPKLPKSICRVTADGCTSLTSDSDQYEVWNSWHNMEEQKLYIIKRSQSHTYGLVMSALPFISWLQRYHEKFYTSQLLRTAHGLVAGADTIPPWFENQRSSSSVIIMLPTEFHNKSIPWMGYALYVCSEVHETFDTSCSFKVLHKFDCHFDTNEGPLQKQTLYHELNVALPPFTGPTGYWLYITYTWFSQRLNAFNECMSIEASTITDIPGVEINMSSARLLYNQQDFREFIEAITSNAWRLLSSRNTGSSSPHVPMWAEEYQGCNSRLTIPLKERLESLPLKCYESLRTYGGSEYIVEGNPDDLQTASALGEIFQEFHGDNIFYTTCSPQCKVPEWFCRDLSGPGSTNGWKGFAVCIAFKVSGDGTLAHANLDMKYTLRTNSGLSEEKIHHVTEATMEELIRLKQHDFMWISYTSRGSFPNYVINDTIEVVFQNDSQDLRVQKWGCQLVFQDDMEGFVEAIMQASLMSSDFEK